jgi:hypothetical protein
MAATVNKQSTRVDYSQLVDSLTNTTAVSDAFGTSGKIYFLYVSSSGGASSGSFDYLKLFDTKEQVTVGTTLPDFIFPITYGATEIFHFPDGLTISNGLGYNASNTGGTAAGSSPARTLSIQMVFK